MTNQYDEQKTLEYFAKNSNFYDYYDQGFQPTPRDQILLKKILPLLGKKKLTVIDYGCGAGGLSGELTRRGYHVIGIEPNPKLYELAQKKMVKAGKKPEQIKNGSLDQLAKIAKGSCDVFIAMGIVQYLSPKDYQKLFRQIKRVLKKKGTLVCTFQNALFDLFTFNKYTLEFFETHVFAEFKKQGLDQNLALNEMKNLIAKNDLPSNDSTRARDNIYVRTHNPLTVGEELKNMRFQLKNLHFYSFFPVPPLISGSQKDIIDKIIKKMEVRESQSWQGYFMANALLVEAKNI